MRWGVQGVRRQPGTKREGLAASGHSASTRQRLFRQMQRVVKVYYLIGNGDSKGNDCGVRSERRSCYLYLVRPLARSAAAAAAWSAATSSGSP